MGELKMHNSTLNADLDSVTAEYDDIQRQLAQERAKNLDLENKTVHLRSMLIPATESQLSDSEVVAKFTSLRSQILKLVKTAWSRNLVQRRSLSEEQTEVLSPFYKNDVSFKYLDNRLQSVVFSILEERVFGARHYATNPDHAILNANLGRVEALLWHKISKGNFEEVTSPLCCFLANVGQTTGNPSPTGALLP